MEAPSSSAFWRLAGLFGLVFGVAMLATVFVWQYGRQQDSTIAQQRFDVEADELLAVLNQRMQSYEAVLRSAAALYAASENVSRTEWREFTASLRLDLSHPGLQGIGYAPRVPKAELRRHIEQARAEGLSQYQVQPEQASASHDYFPIYFLEPVDWRNLRSFGFDAGSDPIRWQAMQQARDEGRPMLTAALPLSAVGNQPASLGVVMFWPLYRRSALPEPRAALLHGFVFSRFAIADLIQGALGSRLEQLHLIVTDTTAGANNAILFSTAHDKRIARFAAVRELSIPGRSWQLHLTSTPYFEASLPSGSAFTLLLSGSFFAMLLATMMVLYARQRERLHRQQIGLTEQLKQREERFRMLMDGAPNAMLMVDANGCIEWLNPQAESLFGYSKDELQNQPMELLLPERYRQQHVGFRLAFQQAPSPRQMGSGRELFARRKDGSEVPVEIGLSPVHTDDGIKTIGSIIDLTARKHAEERARMLVEAAPNAIVLVNASGAIELVNSQTENLFGYSRSELLGQSVEMLIPDKWRAQHPKLREGYHQAPAQRQMGGNR
ncbi:MAG TPA: CHASE domain-containing protein, partial [Permianibacter sp.]|nr:CHASE domain-containing protein [Permianibacter sp.]